MTNKLGELNMTKNTNRSKVGISDNLIKLVIELYPQANSVAAAMQMHLMNTLPNMNASEHQGNNDEDVKRNSSIK